MRLPTFARQKLRVQMPGTRLVHGSEVDDWQAPTERVIPGCMAVPADTDEVETNRTSVRTGYIIYLPSRYDIDPRERVDIAGTWYSVQGDALPIPSPSGGNSHKRLHAEKWRG
jgi:hypothetical protein